MSRMYIFKSFVRNIIEHLNFRHGYYVIAARVFICQVKDGNAIQVDDNGLLWFNSMGLKDYIGILRVSQKMGQVVRLLRNWGTAKHWKGATNCFN